MMKDFFAVKSILVVFLSVIFSLSFVTLLQATEDKKDKQQDKVLLWTFEDVAIGSVPEGWKVEATRQDGPLATWQVVEDKSAPSGHKVLGLVRVNHNSGSTFNLCWTDRVSFKDGTIEVWFKPIKGRIDQGGGIIWRVQDKDNYYIARFNPLEDNFRIYYVANGHRMMMNHAHVSLPAGKWHVMKIVQNGDEYECYLNGKKYLEGHNSHFKESGGVGLWTKADAVTSFDDFKVWIK